jgi:hypothetical protein
MPEKLRFEGKPVVLLLVFGESFRAGMDGTIVQKDLKICIILIHITDARRGGYIVCESRFLRPLIVRFGYVLGCFNEYPSAPGSHHRHES